MIHRLLMVFNTYMYDDDFLWIFSRSIKHGSYNVQWKHGLRGLKPDSEVVVLISYKWSKKIEYGRKFLPWWKILNARKLLLTDENSERQVLLTIETSPCHR